MVSFCNKETFKKENATSYNGLTPLWMKYSVSQFLSLKIRSAFEVFDHAIKSLHFYATLNLDRFRFMSHRFLDEYYSQFDDRVSQSHVDNKAGKALVDNTNARMDAYSTDYDQETISDQQVPF